MVREDRQYVIDQWYGIAQIGLLDLLVKKEGVATKTDFEDFKRSTAPKEDVKVFATKTDFEDFEKFIATKEDLKLFATNTDFENSKSL